MDGVLLCPGPTLTRFDGEHCGLRVAVNRAATRYQCDVWACGDYPAIVAIGPKVIGAPELFCAGSQASWLVENKRPWRGSVSEFESVQSHSRGAINWDMFSATAALVLMASRGVKRIAAYGVDHVGTSDWDGSDGSVLHGRCNRSVDRWRVEQEIWDNLVARLGLEITKG